jgi:hypothetical protein
MGCTSRSARFVPRGAIEWPICLAKSPGEMFPEGVQENVVLPAEGVCDPARLALCIWGAAFRFDDEGQVFYIGTRRVGRIHR